eukprot:3762254-Rhodomonas_salina.6
MGRSGAGGWQSEAQQGMHFGWEVCGGRSANGNSSWQSGRGQGGTLDRGGGWGSLHKCVMGRPYLPECDRAFSCLSIPLHNSLAG